jgi:transposase
MVRPDIEIYVYLKAIDMRKSINGLVVLVVEQLKANPQSGHLYVFSNRGHNKVKAVYWAKNGFTLIYKRLEKGRFQFPDTASDTPLCMGVKELQWLLAGFHFSEMSAYPKLDFTDYF